MEGTDILLTEFLRRGTVLGGNPGHLTMSRHSSMSPPALATPPPCTCLPQEMAPEYSPCGPHSERAPTTVALQPHRRGGRPAGLLAGGSPRVAPPTSSSCSSQAWAPMSSFSEGPLPALAQEQVLSPALCGWLAAVLGQALLAGQQAPAGLRPATAAPSAPATGPRCPPSPGAPLAPAASLAGAAAAAAAAPAVNRAAERASAAAAPLRSAFSPYRPVPQRAASVPGSSALAAAVQRPPLASRASSLPTPRLVPRTPSLSASSLAAAGGKRKWAEGLADGEGGLAAGGTSTSPPQPPLKLRRCSGADCLGRSAGFPATAGAAEQPRPRLQPYRPGFGGRCAGAAPAARRPLPLVPSPAELAWAEAVYLEHYQHRLARGKSASLPVAALAILQAHLLSCQPPAAATVART